MKQLLIITLTLFYCLAAMAQDDVVVGRRLSIPIYSDTSTANIGGARKAGSIICTYSGGDKFWMRNKTNSQWIEVSGVTIGGGGGSCDSCITDLFAVGDTSLYFARGTDTVFVANLVNAVAGGDTTIFQVVLDSTLNQNVRVLFAKDGKISSDAYYLYDPVNRKMVLGHNNISVGGPNTKLYVKGNVNFTDALTVNGQITNPHAVANTTYDTLIKPLGIDALGNLRRVGYWPGSGGGSMVYPSAGIAVSNGSGWGASITDNSANWNTAFGWGNHASAGYVPQSRTINGFDLSADRTLTTTDIGEGSNLYFTNARARAALSLTTTGTSGAATYDNSTGVLNIPQYSGGGGSGVTTMANIGSVPNADGASISGSTLTLQPANASYGGVVTTAAQTYAGDKTFNGVINAGTGSDRVVFYTNTNSGGNFHGIGYSDLTRQMQFFIGAATNHSFTWNYGGALQTAGTNELMKLTQTTFTLGAGVSFAPTTVAFNTSSNSKLVFHSANGIGIGTNSTNQEMQFYTSSNHRFTFSKAGSLQTGGAGANEIMRIDCSTSSLLLGTSSAVTSSILTTVSTTKGSLPAPRVTNVQQSAISSPTAGLLTYNTDAKMLMSYDGSSYKSTGVISGSYSTSASSQTTFTVTFGGTQPNAAYKVNITPTASLTAAAFYVTNKTSTAFDVVYLSALTGTATFDYSVSQ